MSEPSGGMMLIVFLTTATFLCGISTSAAACTYAADCGWNSVCEEQSGNCGCLPGYSLAANKKDCYDERCGADSACLECADINTCLRCVDYIERGSGRCVATCSASYDLVVEGPQMGKVCPEGMGEEQLMTVVIIVAACGGVLLTALLALVISWRFRSYNERRARLKFMEKMMERKKRDSTATVASDRLQLGNPACGGSTTDVRVYLMKLLRPHRDDLMHMLRETRERLAASPPDSNNSFVYRNMIQQLGRVLVLLSDDTAPMPSDADALLEWAHRVVTLYLHATHSAQQTTLSSASQVSSQRTLLDPVSTPPPSTCRSVVGPSTFRPDQQLVTSDSTDNFRYQPWPALISDSVESVQHCREVSEINIVQLLADHNIQAVDV